MAPQAAYAASKWAFEALSECLAQEMKAFNVRVVIIEPGVIATPIFSKGRPVPQDSPYPHLRRLRALFNASLAKPTSPYVVGEQIRPIVESDSWQLAIQSVRTRCRFSNGEQVRRMKKLSIRAQRATRITKLE